jgi:hypothetical protein
MTAAMHWKNISKIAYPRRRVMFAAAIWFVACLLWSAPAQLVVSLLKPIAPQLQLQNVAGSFWHGTAAQAIWQQNDRAIALGSIEWRINPLSLLWAHPSAHVSTNYGEQFFDARVRVSPLGRFVLRDVRGALPMTLVAQWLPLPVNGMLALQLDRVEIARQQLQALQGNVYWQRAQWQWNSRWLVLGDYSCALQMQTAQQLQCALQGQGALSGSGELALNFAERSYTLQAQLQTDRSLPEEFRQGLSVMLAAQPDANNQLHVKRSGRW